MNGNDFMQALKGMLEAVIQEGADSGVVEYKILLNLKEVVIERKFSEDIFKVIKKYSDDSTTENDPRLEELNECFENLLAKVEELKGE